MMIKCCRCDVKKDESLYSKRAAAPSGRQPMCKACTKVYGAEWRTRNRDKMLAYNETTKVRRAAGRTDYRWTKGKTAYVYIIEHRPSGKVYIGCTSSVWGRLREHYRDIRAGIHNNGEMSLLNVEDLTCSYFEVDTLEEAFDIEQRMIAGNKEFIINKSLSTDYLYLLA